LNKARWVTTRELVIAGAGCLIGAGWLVLPALGLALAGITLAGAGLLLDDATPVPAADTRQAEAPGVPGSGWGVRRPAAAPSSRLDHRGRADASAAPVP
jgi:hypothetical protein